MLSFVITMTVSPGHQGQEINHPLLKSTWSQPWDSYFCSSLPMCLMTVLPTKLLSLLFSPCGTKWPSTAPPFSFLPVQKRAQTGPQALNAMTFASLAQFGSGVHQRTYQGWLGGESHASPNSCQDPWHYCQGDGYQEKRNS